MLKKEQLDFVDIITEVPAHEELVLLCAKYKVPVICQKPMSFSFESCRKMVIACREAQIPFFIHENWRYRAPFVQFKKILDGQPAGKIRRIEFNGVNGGCLAYDAQPFLKTLKHMAATDMGSHLFDIARMLFGEPESLYSSAATTYDDLAGDNFMATILNYPDKVCTVTIGERMDSEIFLDCEYGYIMLNNDYSVTVHQDGGEPITYDPPVVREYPWAAHTKEYLPPDHIENIVTCNRTFYNAFMTGQPPEDTGYENLKTMHMVYSACASIESQSVIKLKFDELI